VVRENFVLKTLLEKGEVIWKPKGNSMTPKIDSGDQVRIKRCTPRAFRVGDIVYAKVRGNHYLHLLSALDNSQGSGYLARYQISNNHGHVNGWTDAKNMFGICVQVKEKVLLTDHELSERVMQAIEKIDLTANMLSTRMPISDENQS
jgi:hypothetical protein